MNIVHKNFFVAKNLFQKTLKIASFYHAGEKLNEIVLKKSCKIFSFCPIIMIQSAFESPSLRLSNALWIICIGYFFIFLSHFDFQVFFSVADSLQSHQNRNIFKIASFLETLFQTQIYYRIKVKSTCKEMSNTNNSLCVRKVASWVFKRT